MDTYTLIEKDQGHEQVLAENLLPQGVLRLMRPPRVGRIATTQFCYEAMNNTTGEIEMDAHWNLYGEWKVRDWRQHWNLNTN